MSESKHTPGPWVVDNLGHEHFDDTNHLYGIGAWGSQAYRVAKVEGMGGPSKANALLIAAAPELLEACQLAVDELADMRPPHVTANDMEGVQNPNVAVRVRAAIAKATEEPA